MRVLKTIHLSDFQKKVLVIVKSAQTPQVAFEELRKQAAEDQSNMNSARDMLQKLGLLQVGEGDLSVTPQGEKVMQDEYLIDESGELTAEAQKYLEDASGNQDAETQQPQGEDPMGGMGDEMGGEEDMDFGGEMDMDDDMSLDDIESSFEGDGEKKEKDPFESLDLFRFIDDQSKFLKN